MWHPFDFFATHGDIRGWLERIDLDLARLCRERGCWRCEGRLDIANYPRRVRDLLVDPYCGIAMAEVIGRVQKNGHGYQLVLRLP